MLLHGKVAVVTGASRGIGRKIVEKFAEEGAMVAFTYLSSAQKALDIEQRLTETGHKVKAYLADASDFKSSEALVEKILSDFGQLDIVVNNAGITRDNLLLRMSEQQWDEVMAQNLKSVFNLTKAASRPMIKQKEGVFIHISSVVGIKGNAGQANYAASKAGIIGFGKSVALELASRNIRSNVIAPGFIRTEMTDVLPATVTDEWIKNIPMKKMGETDDVANVALFLASPMSAYVNGQVISVCGGLST